MWNTTQRWKDTLAHSHEQLSYVEILQNGDVVATITGHDIVDPSTGALVQSIGGSVDVARQEVRRSGTIQFLDISGALAANEVRDLFQPLITEVRPWVGLRYWDAVDSDLIPKLQPDGTYSVPGPITEFVPIATLVVTSIEGTYPRLDVAGFDRAWMIGPFTATFHITKGTLNTDAIQRILASQLPAARIDTSGIIETEHVTGELLYIEQDDANTALHDITNATGQILYCDPMGVFTTRDESTTDDTPVMTYSPGALSMMMKPSRKIDASSAYNAVVFTGEATDGPPLRGYAQDDNPNSLTYVGKVGVRPYFASSPLMKTNAQCEKAAQTRLNNILGIPDTITVPIMPNHALESGDVIQVQDLSQDIDFPLIVDAFPVPMRVVDGEQVLSCRSQVIR